MTRRFEKHMTDKNQTTKNQSPCTHVSYLSQVEAYHPRGYVYTSNLHVVNVDCHNLKIIKHYLGPN